MSEAQLAANRANAREDGTVRPYPRNGKAPEATSGQGPKTEEGKQKARLNAMRHGLTGQTVIQTVEDSVAHRDFMLPIMQKLAPKGALEIQYAQLIAQDHYRLNRIAAAEQSHLALSLSRDDIGVRNSNFVETDVAYSHSNSFHRDAKTVQLLSLYESRINRNLKKNMEQLAQLQATRKAEEAQAMEEAELLAELAEHEGWTFDPAEFGFVFSKEIFEKRIHRKRLLDKARTLRSIHKIPDRLAA